MKRYLPAKRSHKAERRFEQFDRAAKKCARRMEKINGKILARALDERKRRRELRRFDPYEELDQRQVPGPTADPVITHNLVNKTGGFRWVQTISMRTTVRSNGW
jgi:hypothetical protein